jgi:2'-5' RNA ligase
VPDHHRALLDAYVTACAAAAPGFRWVAPESLHLTLRFLGNVDDDALQLVTAELGRIERPPYEARLGGLGYFGGLRRTSVVWLDLAGGREATAELAGDCERACQAAGLLPEWRPFRPHVTLARSRTRGGEHLPGLPVPPDLGPWLIDGFVLFESRLGGGRPPQYLPLARFPFRRC